MARKRSKASVIRALMVDEGMTRAEAEAHYAAYGDEAVP